MPNAFAKPVPHRRLNAVELFLRLCLPLLLAGSAAVAALDPAPPTLRLVSFPIPILVGEDGSHGVFIELTKEIAKRTGTRVQIDIAPPVRARRYFSEGKYDGMFPVLKSTFEHQDYHRTRQLITTKRDFIFSRVDDPLYQQLGQLRGKRLGVTWGYSYPQREMEDLGVILEPADSDHANARRLALGRIDAFYVEERTGLQAFSDIEVLPQVQYCRQCPVHEYEVYYVFTHNAQGERLAGLFDEALMTLRRDGTYDKIFAVAQKTLSLHPGAALPPESIPQ